MRTLALLAILASWLPGCSDPSAEEACDDLAKAACNKLDSCLTTFIKTAYGDVATCIARTKLSCEPSLEAPGSKMTTGKVSSCASALEAQTCAEVLGRDTPEACRPPAGDLSPGIACSADAQCTGAYCKKKEGKTCGVCSNRVAAGEACDNSDDCTYGLTCTDKICVEFVAAGQACDPKHPCKPPLGCEKGTCIQPKAGGESCDPTDQNTCDQTKGLYCGLVAKTCKQMTVAKDGEACGVLTDGYAVCEAAGRCEKGTCMKAAADGAACDPLLGPDCLPPAKCVDGACKLEDPAACK